MTPKSVSSKSRALHYGYRRIRVLLGREGWMVSRKQVQHIRRQEGLKVRPKPKKMPRRGLSTGLPTQARHRHHVWTWDFSAPCKHRQRRCLLALNRWLQCHLTQRRIAVKGDREALPGSDGGAK